MAMLRKRMAEISLMNLDKLPTDRAAFGSTVHVASRGGDTLVYQLVMPEDADATKGLISTSSPIGKALIGQAGGRRDHRSDADRRPPVRDGEAHHHPRRGRVMGRPGREPYSPRTSHRPGAHAAPARPGPTTPACCGRCAEAGVRIDLVAGHGIGAVGAFFAAIDGGARLWAPDGFWRQPAVAGFYPWRPTLRVLGWALCGGSGPGRWCRSPCWPSGSSCIRLAFGLTLLHLQAGADLAEGYARLVGAAFRPGAPADVVPQSVVFLCGGAARALMLASRRTASRGGRRRARGHFWWRVSRRAAQQPRGHRVLADRPCGDS